MALMRGGHKMGMSVHRGGMPAARVHLDKGKCASGFSYGVVSMARRCQGSYGVFGTASKHYRLQHGVLGTASTPLV